MTEKVKARRYVRIEGDKVVEWYECPSGTDLYVTVTKDEARKNAEKVLKLIGEDETAPRPIKWEVETARPGEEPEVPEGSYRVKARDLMYPEDGPRVGVTSPDDECVYFEDTELEGVAACLWVDGEFEELDKEDLARIHAWTGKRLETKK